MLFGSFSILTISTSFLIQKIHAKRNEPFIERACTVIEHKTANIVDTPPGQVYIRYYIFIHGKTLLIPFVLLGITVTIVGSLDPEIHRRIETKAEKISINRKRGSGQTETSHSTIRSVSTDYLIALL